MIRSSGRSIPGFEAVDHPGATVFARPEAVPWVRYVLEGGVTLYEAAAQDREAVSLPGREPVFAIPAKVARGEEAQRSRDGEVVRGEEAQRSRDGEVVRGEEAQRSRDGKMARGPETERIRKGEDPGPRWAVRHFARGGRVFPALLGDRFLKMGTPRPLHELLASEEARARGISTPRVLAAAIYPTALFYRADLVTAFLPESTDLVDTLFETRRRGMGGASERLEALKAAGTLIRTMATAGLRHGDLHAGNILLRWEGTAPSSHVLDLDRSHLYPEGSVADPGPMVRRLKRSLRKWEGRTGLRLTAREWETLEAAAMG